MIDTRQKLEGWDSGVIPHRTAELKRGQERNIDLMTAFYQDCPDSTPISPQPAAKLRQRFNFATSGGEIRSGRRA